MKQDDRARVTVPGLARTKVRSGDAPIVVVTAYDYHGCRWANAAGVDVILVGDSLGMVIQGDAGTLGVTVDDVVYHLRCIGRARPSALVVGDMPWLSYHVSAEESVRNAGRLVQQGGATAVKVEGGRQRVAVIQAILAAEIPVMGHVGLTPQSVNAMGGFRVQGRSPEGAARILDDARALEDAGVFAVVLEGIPADLASRITDALDVPTIGIGAGAGCDGQVLVMHDLLGITPDPAPRFVRRYADIGAQAQEAIARFARDVRTGAFPSSTESYHAPVAVSGPVPATVVGHAQPVAGDVPQERRLPAVGSDAVRG